MIRDFNIYTKKKFKSKSVLKLNGAIDISIGSNVPPLSLPEMKKKKIDFIISSLTHTIEDEELTSKRRWRNENIAYYIFGWSTINRNLFQSVDIEKINFHWNKIEHICWHHRRWKKTTDRLIIIILVVIISLSMLDDKLILKIKKKKIKKN